GGGPRLDVALLPVAGWGPTLGTGHMGPLDAARAARLIHPRIAIPVHWGTLLPIGLAGRHGGRLGDPPRAFVEHAALLAPDIEVRILQPGQETTL
ncbi:MAG: MBL fold metallo-hydrolase, partial [Solirubrobacteraceae bacterium]